MDLTICIMLPPRGATDFSASAHPKWRVLSFVSVTYMGDTTQPITAPRTGYVHVTGVPTPVAWAGLSSDEILQRVNYRLCRVWENFDVDGRPSTVEKREFAGIASLIPVNAANRLLTDRQITVTWTQFKNFVQNVREARALADSDLN